MVLYCRTGNRSWQAAAWLSAQGWTGVYNLEGGIVRWYRAGLPVDTTPVEVGYAATPFKEVGPRGGEAFGGGLGGGRAGGVGVPGRPPPQGREHPPFHPAPEAFRAPPGPAHPLVCNSGNRSGVAADFLVQQGFPGEKVYNLEGGTYAWMGAGFPVER